MIRVRVLGSSAGGGLPQWNCACANCEAARRGCIPARTQSCVAFSHDGAHWFLVNASPDLRAQIERFPPLQPGLEPVRNSPLEAILLSNADLDHVLGLALLREGAERLVIHATPAVRATLEIAGIGRLLAASCGADWRDAVSRFFPLERRDGVPSGLSCRAVDLSGIPPRYAAGQLHPGVGHSVAWQIADEQTGASVLIAPDVAAFTPELHAAMETADAVLMDGTFWSDTELGGIRGTAATAKAMGHLPIDGGSFEAMRRLRARYRVYIHVNNTNPILARDSAERAAIEEAGITVGEDGMEFEL